MQGDAPRGAVHMHVHHHGHVDLAVLVLGKGKAAPAAVSPGTRGRLPAGPFHHGVDHGPRALVGQIAQAELHRVHTGHLGQLINERFHGKDAGIGPQPAQRRDA